jgi:hypothetical protein
MATNTTSYLELSKSYQDQVLGMIEQSQKIAVETVGAWAKAAQPYATATQPYAKVATPAGVDVPSPKELVDNAFGFAEKLLAAQHEFMAAVVTAAEPATPKAAPATK